MVIWSRAGNVLWRSVPGYLVLATDGGTPSEVFGSGSEVWELLQHPVETEALVTALAETYSTTVELVRPAVERLLEQLQAGGYVEQTG